MPVQIIDLFCGIGGLTKGLINSGLNVIGGIDNDKTCEYAYHYNNRVPFYCKDIRLVSGEELMQLYNNDVLKILVGCAPCQPFSSMRYKLHESNKKDEKYNLLLEFERLIVETEPTIISMENVPRIKDTTVFKRFTRTLRRLGYNFSSKVVYCPDYGIPQTRRRFVFLASRLGEIDLINPTHNRDNVTIDQFILGLPQLGAGDIDPNDPMHRSARMSDINIRRIRASRPGGTWRDWPEELVLECHRKESGRSYGSVYGRMSWGKVGPTITTQFYSYGTGRHGHPDQDRGLSLREGALLQTFPIDYDFINPDTVFSFRDIARHIGNAVPVRLGEVIGISIRNHLENLNINI